MLLFGYTLLPGWCLHDRHERRLFFALWWAEENIQIGIFTMFQCVCAGWETDIKGKTEKHHCSTDSGFCFRLMEWEIQACKCNSPLRSSIHSPKRKKKTKENHPASFLFHKYKVFHKCAHIRASFCWLWGQVMNENAAATWWLVVLTALLCDEPGNDFWEKLNSAF